MELTRTEHGFSVIEVLIATLIFLIIAVGILPLFAASAKNNLDGQEATEVSNFGKSGVEDLLQAPFSDARLTIPAGSTELLTDEYWSKIDKVWKTGTGTTADPPVWRRHTRVRQFNVSDLTDNGVFDNPLIGSIDLGQVHIKEIEVEIWHSRSDQALYLGKPSHYTVRMLKSK
jgi:prepilin-type N-terminal cleavage/methylation domain-containing protein